MADVILKLTPAQKHLITLCVAAVKARTEHHLDGPPGTLDSRDIAIQKFTDGELGQLLELLDEEP